MMTAAAESVVTVAKFRGCLVGALIGDCLGGPFEGDATVPRGQLHNYLEKLEQPSFKAPLKMYTDDTTMTISIIESLIQQNGFDGKDLAKRFVSSYFANPRRGYGTNVVQVFHQMRKDNFEDVWKPARQLFDGSGSYGNGGAMRIAPIALFTHSDYNSMVDMAKNCTKLTHTNRLGVNGALLQCAAIHMSLRRDPSKPLNTKEFMSELSEKIFEIEKKDDVFGNEEQYPFGKQVELIKKLLAKDPPDFEEDITSQLGNSIAALYSVPTAIYCFLRGQRPVDFIKTDNPFRRVLQLAIQMGGDTDTIASMGCAISGAYHGESIINATFHGRCEGVAEMRQRADRLYEKSQNAS